MLKKFAVIVAGGKGNRMNTEIPKQFLEISGKPVLMHTFDAFVRYDNSVEFILVLPEEQIPFWKELCNKHQFAIPHQIAKGGATRFQSVNNGLAKISGNGIVFIHDGVRPLVSIDTIENCCKMAVASGNALPVIPPSESIRYKDDAGNKAVDRSKYFLVQTPQTFNVTTIKQAFAVAPHDQFTDDASVLENTGAKINLVEGNRENIKITWTQDLEIAASFLRKQKSFRKI